MTGVRAGEPSDKAAYKAFPRWPWVATWAVLIAAGLAVLVSTVYAVVRLAP